MSIVKTLPGEMGITISEAPRFISELRITGCSCIYEARMVKLLHSGMSYSVKTFGAVLGLTISSWTVGLAKAFHENLNACIFLYTNNAKQKEILNHALT